jgi:hypothetical protein
MCHTAVGLISTALQEVDNAESLLKTKNLIALFMQTMNVGTFATIGRLLLNSKPQDLGLCDGSFRRLTPYLVQKIC